MTVKVIFFHKNNINIYLSECEKMTNIQKNKKT